MNGDPYARTSQSSDRRVINRSGASAPSRAPEEAVTPREEPQNVRSTGSRRSASLSDTPPARRSKKGLWWTIGIIVLVLGIGVAGWLVWSNSKGANAGIDNSKYQAVFLANGQIYFGKLTSYNSDYFRLTTGYSAQASAAGADQAEEEQTDQTIANSDVQLIRLGDEVYGPENEIFISKQQVLHFENLKKDSKVTQLIDQNEASRQ